jgi:putative transposase
LVSSRSNSSGSKKSPLRADQRRALIDRDHATLTIARQCELLDLPRSTFYDDPTPRHDAKDLLLMQCMDKISTEAPFYGSRRMVAQLRRDGHEVNRKHVQRLMREMGLEAIYGRPKTSQANPDHRKFPYLLREVTIDRPNFVWRLDMTYLPMRGGFLYLAAVIDWFSRYVLAWELSNRLETSFCREALGNALKLGKPAIFNTDQGVQFTSRNFSTCVLDAGMKLSMDGRGRAFDNLFTERLWRSVTYEEVYLKEYLDGLDAHRQLTTYVGFDNERRLHQALGYQTPREVHVGGAASEAVRIKTPSHEARPEVS